MASLARGNSDHVASIEYPPQAKRTISAKEFGIPQSQQNPAQKREHLAQKNDENVKQVSQCAFMTRRSQNIRQAFQHEAESAENSDEYLLSYTPLKEEVLHKLERRTTAPGVLTACLVLTELQDHGEGSEAITHFCFQRNSSE